VETIHSILEQAKKELSLADHLLTSTYPLTQDPKILVGVLRNMHKAQDDIMTATIAFFLPKQLPSKSSSFIVKLGLFRTVAQERNIASNQEISTLEQTHSLFEKHERSTVEFARKKNMVLASESFELQTLSQPQLKTILANSRLLLKKILVAVN
jgi:hypothetical protein